MIPGTRCLTASLLLLTLAACGEDPTPVAEKEERQSGNHIWRGQTDSLQTARDVAGDLEQQQSRLEDRINQNRD